MNKFQKALLKGFACGLVTGLAIGSLVYGKGGNR